MPPHATPKQNSLRFLWSPTRQRENTPLQTVFFRKSIPQQKDGGTMMQLFDISSGALSAFRYSYKDNQNYIRCFVSVIKQI